MGREATPDPARPARGMSFYERLHARWADAPPPSIGQPPPPELAQVRRLLGTWSTGSTRFATPTTPERTRENPERRCRWRPTFGGRWLVCESADADEPMGISYLTYDPIWRRWALLEIAVGVTWGERVAPAWTGDELVVAGPVRVFDEVVTCRHRLVKVRDDLYKWANEERQADGSWRPIDEHRFYRVPAPVPNRSSP